jgi:hypothetical protein
MHGPLFSWASTLPNSASGPERRRGKSAFTEPTMEILIYVLAYGIGLALNTAILAISLFLVEDRNASSFKELGVMPTLVRCAGIALATMLLSLIPFGFLLALVAWFIGIMIFFQKTFVQTLVLFLINVIFGCGVLGAVGYVLSKVLHS